MWPKLYKKRETGGDGKALCETVVSPIARQKGGRIADASIPHAELDCKCKAMDASLLREREAFLKRAKALPVVEKPRAAPIPSNDIGPPPIKRVAASVPSDLRSAEFRPALQGKFAVLSSVVKYMKQRHLERDTHPLTVEEILEEARLHDTPQSTIRWLEDEALPNNPKIRVTPDRKFVFKPRYDIRNRHDLYMLLKRHDLKGLGGISMDDIAESIADAERLINVSSFPIIDTICLSCASSHSFTKI
ncbi:unnamed protein product [Echinostoma caproni]|uniref:TFIIE beta domain-containing protein n=1 Tax=Echinostoma caproni TaxID=27848 RepID=A0A183B831_9TREM|nr:unnamed protein product [Echinostoma caproni]